MAGIVHQPRVKKLWGTTDFGGRAIVDVGPTGGKGAGDASITKVYREVCVRLTGKITTRSFQQKETDERWGKVQKLDLGYSWAAKKTKWGEGTNSNDVSANLTREKTLHGWDLGPYEGENQHKRGGIKERGKPDPDQMKAGQIRRTSALATQFCLQIHEGKANYPCN